jgi:NAD(P)-dependent dehydrogenase (short-subunit alcohol dehydrogenase family)
MLRALIVAAGALGTVMLLRERAREAAAIDLAGKVVLVTGGSRGLGLLLAREFGRQRARVAMCARDAAELDRAREHLALHGVDAFATVCDVRDRDAVQRMVDDVIGRFGGLDVLVNNAGIIQVGPVATMSVEDFEDAMAVNFWGVVHTTLAALPGMRRRRSGRIVNITSIGGKVSVPRLLPYGASKFAAVGFSEGLRAELAPEGIHVVTVVPGLMRTGSYLNASFKGDAPREARWFGLGATLPLVSMDAERAARQIVRAARRGDPERILSLPAAALAGVHGLLPGTTVELMTLANRFLLPARVDGTHRAVRGMELEPWLGRWFSGLTALGRVAARRFGERPGPVSTAGRAGATGT